VGIDWFTVGAQLVNFAILFALLSRFLYGPIVEAVDRRKSRIAERLEEAQRREEEADKRRAHYEEKQAELERERESLIAEAKREAERERSERLEEVRREVQEARKNWFARLQNERERFVGEFTDRVEEQIVGIARDALEDLADARLEGQIIDRLVARLTDTEAAERERLREEFARAEEPVVVRTAFELGDSERERVAGAVSEIFDREVPLQFEPDGGMVAGVELRVGGHRFGWSIESYLEQLRGEIDEVLGDVAGRADAEEMAAEEVTDGVG
jgi:F-type H+-transporting ATPase subunit b